MAILFHHQFGTMSGRRNGVNNEIEYLSFQSISTWLSSFPGYGIVMIEQPRPF